MKTAASSIDQTARFNLSDPSIDLVSPCNLAFFGIFGFIARKTPFADPSKLAQTNLRATKLPRTQTQGLISSHVPA
jgi:hypothetical protein